MDEQISHYKINDVFMVVKIGRKWIQALREDNHSEISLYSQRFRISLDDVSSNFNEGDFYWISGDVTEKSSIYGTVRTMQSIKLRGTKEEFIQKVNLTEETRLLKHTKKQLIELEEKLFMPEKYLGSSIYDLEIEDRIIKSLQHISSLNTDKEKERLKQLQNYKTLPYLFSFVETCNLVNNNSWEIKGISLIKKMVLGEAEYYENKCPVPKLTA